MQKKCQIFAFLFLFPIMLNAMPAAAANELKKDGRFIVSNDETVLDTKTRLMWASTDNGADIDQNDAKQYCEAFRGGGYKDWRMPTLNELETLCEDIEETQPASCRGIKGQILNVFVTPSISLSCVYGWSSNTRGSEGMQMLFNYCHKSGAPPKRSAYTRALPVRSSK
jgi:hypothetical protein